MFKFNQNPLDKDIAKTAQHSEASLNSEGNISKEEGEMFGNPYGENDYNIPGHEEDERLKDKTKDFVSIEDVADKDAEHNVYKQFGEDLSPEESEAAELELKNAYDDEAEFKLQAMKKLNASEFNTLFSFLKSMEDDDARKDYLGTRDEKGDFVSPIKTMPREITNLIKKVNNRKVMIESMENNYDDEGNYVDSTSSKVSADSIKFKAPKADK